MATTTATTTGASNSGAAVTAMEGFLNKKGRIAWKKRWFVLQGNALTYFAKKGDAKFRNQMLLTAEVLVCACVCVGSNGSGCPNNGPSVRDGFALT